jgi:hypothetical protein
MTWSPYPDICPEPTPCVRWTPGTDPGGAPHRHRSRAAPLGKRPAAAYEAADSNARR